MPEHDAAEIAKRRAAARRTAIVVGVVALVVYVAFLASGVLGALGK